MIWGYPYFRKSPYGWDQTPSLKSKFNGRQRPATEGLWFMVLQKCYWIDLDTPTQITNMACWKISEHHIGSRIYSWFPRYKLPINGEISQRPPRVPCSSPPEGVFLDNFPTSGSREVISSRPYVQGGALVATAKLVYHSLNSMRYGQSNKHTLR